jgi:hypothetical protein
MMVVRPTNLRGYDIPTEVSESMDHTYVRSDDGCVFPCWGISENGKQICSGVGCSNQATCIAGSESEAGIIDAITGVCHQTANRILYKTEMIVSNAVGYWCSNFFTITMELIGLFTNNIMWILFAFSGLPRLCRPTPLPRTKRQCNRMTKKLLM